MMIKYYRLLFICIVLFGLTSSCEDKDRQSFGKVSLSIDYQETVETTDNSTDNSNEYRTSEQNSSQDELNREKNLLKDSELSDLSLELDVILDENEDLNERSAELLQDYRFARIVINNGTPVTLDLTSLTNYSKTIAIGQAQVAVDLLNLDNLVVYNSVKNVQVVEDVTTSVTFLANDWAVQNQEIEITSSFFTSYSIGNDVPLFWNNTHNARGVKIELFQNTPANIIRLLESNFIGNSYNFDTSNESPINNLGMKVTSVLNDTSYSQCCFDIVDNNEAPTTENITETTDEDQSVEIQFDGDDSDGDSIAYSIATNPANGSLGSINGDKITYTPNQDFNGTDTFTYKANDGILDSNTATITITINAINDPPIANSFEVNTDFETSTQFDLQVSDVDEDNLSSSITSTVSNGSIAFTGANSIAYNPNTNFSGTDSFNYVVNDGNVDSAVATVTINVGNPPVVVTYPNGGEVFSPDQIITLTWDFGFSNTGIELLQDGSKVLDINGDVGSVNQYSWTIPSALSGNNFKIRVYDAGSGTEFDESDETFIIASNARPTAEDVSQSTDEDQSVEVQMDGNDEDGDTLTYSIVSSPSNGTLGSIVGNKVTYTPSQDFNGTDTFTYKANDGLEDSDDATVTISVNAINDTPVVNSFSVETYYETVTSFNLQGSDVDEDDLTYNITSDVTNGTLEFTGTNAVKYTPNNGFLGNDSFSYTANDGTIGSASANVSINVLELSVRLTYPNGNEILSQNETIDITWEGGFDNTGIELLQDGSKVLDINGDVGSVNQYSWTIPTTLSGSNFKIRVYDAGSGTEFDESDETFTINADKLVTVETPTTILTSDGFYTFTWSIKEGTSSSGFEQTGVELWKDGNKVLDLGTINNINIKNFGPWLPPYQARIDCDIISGAVSCQSLWEYGSGPEGGYQLRVYDASDTDGNQTQGFSGTFQMDLTKRLLDVNAVDVLNEVQFGDVKILNVTSGNVGNNSLLWAIVTVGNPDNNIEADKLLISNFDYETFRNEGGGISCSAVNCGLSFDSSGTTPVILPFGGQFTREQYLLKLYVDFQRNSEELFYVSSWQFGVSTSQNPNQTSNGADMLITTFENREFSNYDKIPFAWKSGDKNSSQIRLSHEQNIGSAYTDLGGDYTFNFSTENNVEKTYNYFAPIDYNGSSEERTGNFRFDVIDREALVFYENNDLGHDYVVFDPEVNLYRGSVNPLAYPYLFFDSDTMYVNISEPEVSLNTPTNGSIIKLGEPLTISWDTSSMRNASIASIEVDWAGVGGGEVWARNIANSGSYTFTPKLVDVYTSSFQPGQSKEYQMFIKAENTHENPDITNPQEHTSNSINITIDGSNVSEPVVTYPNGGETLIEGETYTLRWNFTAISDSVDLELLGGPTPNASNVQWTKRVLNDGEYNLTVPDVLQEDENGSSWVYKLNIKSFKDNGPGLDNVIGTYHDQSDAVFNINENTSNNFDGTMASATLFNGLGYYEEIIEVDAVGSLKDINVKTTGSLSVQSQDHLRYMEMFLVSPNNTRILLFKGDQTPQQGSGSGSISSNTSGMTNTTFDQDVGTSIYNGSGSFIGSYKPDENLDVLIGEEINGTWRIIYTNSSVYTATFATDTSANDTFLSLDIEYTDNGGISYVESNNRSYQNDDGSTWINSGIGTNQYDIEFGEEVIIGDLDLELSINASHADAMRYMTISADIGDAAQAVTLFQGDQVAGSSGYQENSFGMYEARFDDSAGNNYLQYSLVASRILASGLSAFEGQNASKFRLYITNTSVYDLTVNKQKTKVLIDGTLSNNNAPVANDMSVSVVRNTNKIITLDAADQDGDALTYEVVINPSHGTVSSVSRDDQSLFKLLEGNSLTYTPSTDFSGSDSFTYRVNDGSVNSNLATVSIVVNDPPSTSDYTTTTNTNSDRFINFSNHSTDTEGDNLTFSIVEPPSNGVVVVDGIGATYTPTTDFTGSDSFTFKANDGVFDSNISTITVEVGNSIIINNDIYAHGVRSYQSYIPLDYSTEFNVENMVIDNHNNPKGSVGFAKCENGTANNVPCDNEGKFYVFYEANSGGYDEFTFYLQDEFGTSSNIMTGYTSNSSNSGGGVSAALSVEGNWPSTEEGSDRVMTFDSNVVIEFSAAVIIDKLQLRYMQGNTWIGQKDLDTNINPDHPNISPAFSSNGLYYQFVFSEELITSSQPSGTDGYKFAALTTSPSYRSDGFYIGDNISQAEYNMIYRPNHSPVATDYIANDGEEDSPYVIDLDDSDNPTTGTKIIYDQNGESLLVEIVSNPSNGSIDYNESENEITYTPNKNFYGTDQITYKVYDGYVYSEVKTITYNISQSFDDQMVNYISIQNSNYRNDDWVRMIQETDDGGFVIVHKAIEIDDGGIYPAITKTDSNGNVEWEQIIDSISPVQPTSIRVTSDGGFIISGEDTGSNSQGVLIKTNSQGVLEWSNTYGNPQVDDGLYSVYEHEDGYVANGTTQSFSSGLSINDIYTIKVNSNGSQLWAKGFGTGTISHGPDNSNDHSYGANAIYSDGTNIFSAGARLDQTTSTWKGVYYKYDTNGTLLNSVYANSHSDVYSIHPGNGYIMAGGLAVGESAWPSNTGVMHSFFLSSSQLHVTNYHTAYSEINSQSGYVHSSPTSDGGAIIVGDSLNGDGEPQVQLVKIDASGNVEWSSNFSSEDSSGDFGIVDADYGRFAIETSDGNFVVTGESHHPKPGNDGYVNQWKTLFIKFDSSGQIISSKY